MKILGVSKLYTGRLFNHKCFYIGSDCCNTQENYKRFLQLLSHLENIFRRLATTTSSSGSSRDTNPCSVTQADETLYPAATETY